MSLSRRAFLVATGAAGLLGRTLLAPASRRYPFTLGVASGYPQPDGFTLWTRLAPLPLDGGGMPDAAVPVQWEVAADEGFRTVVRSGTADARPAWGHAVHVDVDRLAPARWYWYRFTALGSRSPSGRSRTAPERAAANERLRLAFASCQQYEQGYYAAYRHMAHEDLDLVVHLGDYIYESSWGRRHVRAHRTPEPRTLVEYRNRYALYKSDRDLQAAHAAFAWLVTWDDHEVQNDYAGSRSQNLDDPAYFLARRAAAYQAYFEHMPLPAWARPRASGMQLYARVDYGSLAQFHVLDGRQYRSPQPCARPGHGGGNTVVARDCRERLDPALSFLGAAQERWLEDGLGRSAARWNVIAQQTLMAQADRHPGDEQVFWTDGWDGYPRARARLLAYIAAERVRNPVVISGDVHMAAVADLKTDFDTARAPVVASEFCGTSITSQGPSHRRVRAMLEANAHIKFADARRRGYTVLDITPARCMAALRTVNDVRDPECGLGTLASYVVEDGRPGPQAA